MKSFISRFLVISILSITFLNTFLLTSFADYRVRNPQKVASDSDARPEFDISDSDTYFQGLGDYQPFADTLPSVQNTISDLSKISVNLTYFTNKDQAKSLDVFLDKNGYFSFSKPSDFAYFSHFEIYIKRSSKFYNSNALPAPGNYNFSGRFSSNTGGFTYNYLRLWRSYNSSNAANLSSSKDASNFQQLSGDFYFSDSVKVASNTTSFSIYLGFTDSSKFSFPFGGYISFNFTQVSDGGGWSTSPAPPPSSTDIEQDISNSVGNISSGVDNINNSINSGVDSINGNLEEIIRTISMQLEALWNQMYNLIHLDDNKNRDENTKKITDKLDQTNKNLDIIDTDILDGFENLEQGNSSNTNSIINNNNQNTSNIINNNNENTDKLANGYDNNSMLENNDKLSGKLDEYEKLEQELLKDTKDNLNNFQFDNPFLSFNAVMSDISYILTSIYNGLGSFNIPIAFSFTLTIAMLCIGWYRFKGGT